MGRGNASGKGTTAGKGTKGQRARQGGRKGLRQLGQKWATQSTPKLPGFAAIQKKVTTVTVEVLNAFNANDTVTVSSLVNKGFIPRAAHVVKIVSGGKVGKKVIIKGIGVSAGAKSQIESAGGTIIA